MKDSITMEALQQMEAEFQADRSNRIAMDAVMNNGLLISAKNAEAYRTTIWRPSSYPRTIRCFMINWRRPIISWKAQSLARGKQLGQRAWQRRLLRYDRRMV